MFATAIRENNRCCCLLYSANDIYYGRNIKVNFTEADCFMPSN